ncbi:DJ-1/PfpI family protein [Cellvibrio sp. KY-GH-1]|uniref:DJ-1/PfpI family protein n=1 Tax=Cellvibrio sp. KY-GH-1 TaxID=2303332 RepID=UPI001245891E|nr:DJ-1/PfpI family protein [Cellvibrio sp. KY-GH-1]QEY16226.1 DJ-1/PfpI family protein [Cellvibrio sp. KY-GH-1]
MNVGIYIYDDAEVLDFSGPFEVFSTAARVNGTPDLFSVYLIGETGRSVTARAGFKVIPDYSIHKHPALDLLVVVGGVHSGEMEKNTVMVWLKQQCDRVPLVATVCTGIFLLANATDLGNVEVTTHWEDIPELRQQFPALVVQEKIRWVDAGSLVTSGGISAGIDMSLYLVSRLHSRDLAEKTARQMEYDWNQR